MFLLIAVIISLAGSDQRKYVGVNDCKLCHKGKKDGYQFEIWQKSKHAGAFKTLRSKQSEDIAKKMGLKKSAAESPECIECHAINDDKLKEDGVQCESCHGAGSAYKSRKVMKNRESCAAAGMAEFKDEEAKKKSCESCHNKKSPTYKTFDFRSSWKEIEHPIP
ncbi:MAG: cytochrome c family protein [Bacteroidetes bacterium]|nr:cytochrome c family protein [Bacteroidota bacterium]